MKSVLITGASGFIGSHLCDKFIKEGYFVIGIDNLITGDLKNLEHLMFNKNFQFIKQDITKHITIKGNLDYILHFASPASPKDYLMHPIKTLKVSSLGVHNLLGLAKLKQARILIASTSEIYGDPKVHPQKESYNGNVNTVGPRGVYEEAKRFQESLTMAYHKMHGVEVRIARIFNTYGPRMRVDDGRVIQTFIKQAVNNEDLTIFGKGTQTRSFCYITDQIEGIYKLLFSNYSLPINIGNPEEVTIKFLAAEIKKYSCSKSKITYLNLPEGDPLKRKPDISLANKILKWQPTVSRENGLKKMISNYKFTV